MSHLVHPDYDRDLARTVFLDQVAVLAPAVLGSLRGLSQRLSRQGPLWDESRRSQDDDLWLFYRKESTNRVCAQEELQRWSRDWRLDAAWIVDAAMSTLGAWDWANQQGWSIDKHTFTIPGSWRSNPKDWVSRYDPIVAKEWPDLELVPFRVEYPDGGDPDASVRMIELRLEDRWAFQERPAAFVFDGRPHADVDSDDFEWIDSLEGFFFDPEIETYESAQARLLIVFKSNWDAAVAAGERMSLLRARQRQALVDHCGWLVRYQVLKESAETIGKGGSTRPAVRQTVDNAVKDLADRIQLPLRDPLPPGRPKKPS